MHDQYWRAGVSLRSTSLRLPRESVALWRGDPRVARKSAQSKPARAFGSPAERSMAEAIDRAYLARFTLGNAALEREVLELFAAQVPVYLSRLREASTAKAWKEAAHTIKGSAAAIGAWRLARFAEMAEKIDVEAAGAVEEGHRDNAVAALATAAEDVCRHIAGLLGDA
jgi:HPt (histidine-containing phosphotransfer) domain-containing protein